MDNPHVDQESGVRDDGDDRDHRARRVLVRATQGRADAGRQPAVRPDHDVYPGAAPEAVEADVTKPIEYAVNQVSGVKRILSNSLEGPSQVFIEFRLSTTSRRAIQDVRDKIAQVRPTFPRDVKDPLVNRVDNENRSPS